MRRGQTVRNQIQHFVECEAYTGQFAWKMTDGTLVPLRGDVRFHQVVFGYVPSKNILDGISLYAKPGHKIAFVGSTGAGKTTMINLVNRFYEIQSGSITYDGIIQHIRKADLENPFPWLYRIRIYLPVPLEMIPLRPFGCHG